MDSAKPAGRKKISRRGYLALCTFWLLFGILLIISSFVQSDVPWMTIAGGVLCALSIALLLMINRLNAP